MSDYHPKRKEKVIHDQAEIERLLTGGKFAVIALCRSDEPYLVSLSYGYDQAKRCLYFHCANAGHKLDFIASNPRACATIIEDRGYLPGQCDHDYASLVIRGKLAVVEDLAEKKHGLLALLEHLEADPQPILARNIKNDASYRAVTILKLTIDAVSGKAYRQAEEG